MNGKEQFTDLLFTIHKIRRDMELKSLQLCPNCNYTIVDRDRDTEDGIIIKCRTLRVSDEINVICPKCKARVGLSYNITNRIVRALRRPVSRPKRKKKTISLTKGNENGLKKKVLTILIS